MSHNQNKRKKEIIEYLEKFPITQAACKNVGISRATYYRWIKDDPDFKERVDEAMEIGRKEVNALAESQLIKGIQAGDKWCIRFWLENNYGQRYAKNKKPIAPESDRPMTIGRLMEEYERRYGTDSTSQDCDKNEGNNDNNTNS